MVRKISSILVLFVGLTTFASPYVTNVVAKQRYPWNGKVDISYTIEGEFPKGSMTLEVAAKDADSDAVYTATALTGDVDKTSGDCRVVWDMEAQGVEIKSDNVIFTVTCKALPYCVVDLSGGKNASSYPVSYLASAPSGGWTDEYKKTKLVLKLIEPGSFKMNGLYDVTLTKPYYIGVFEVTQRQYELVMGTNPSYFSGDMLPAEKISYDMIRGSSDGAKWPDSSEVDSDSFIGMLRARTGLDFDLPTEAQWEYACRAGTTTTYYWGETMDGSYAWYSDNANRSTHVVGTKKANAWGLYDMSGNVCEWCLDWHGVLTSDVDPQGPSSGSDRTDRGGGWYRGEASCGSSQRSHFIPSTTRNDYGFRLVNRYSK